MSVVIHLICHPSWMRDELAKNSHYKIEHSLGLSVPEYKRKDLWWAPQAQAVILLNNVAVAKQPWFIAPIPGLISVLDSKYVRRKTGVVTAEEAASVLFPWDDQFWKMATAKSDIFTAQVRTHDELLKSISEAHLPPTSLLEWSEPIEKLYKEYRCFVRYDDEEEKFVVASASVYLDNKESLTVYDGATASKEELAEAVKFAESVISDHSSETLPPAFVLDVASLEDDSFIVVEMNPVWCSAWYDCDIDEVVLCIQRSFESSLFERKRWKYVPDPLLTIKYGKRKL